jgi:hypothetical protein
MYIGYFREIPYLELSKLYLYTKDDVELKTILFIIIQVWFMQIKHLNSKEACKASKHITLCFEFNSTNTFIIILAKLTFN